MTAGTKSGASLFVVPDGLYYHNTEIRTGEIYESYTTTGFIEIKATAQDLVLSYNDHQITGIIDAAANQSFDPRVGSSVLFITTSDASIPDSTLAYARSRNVSILQSRAEFDPMTDKIWAGPAELRQEALTPLPYERARPMRLPTMNGQPVDLNQ